MEQLNSLKQLESRLSLLANKVGSLQSKLEDLVFRAQRLASAAKNNRMQADTMFGYDLQVFRRELRSFGNELETLPAALAGAERSAMIAPGALNPAQSVMRLSFRVSKALRELHDQALLAHQHLREADHKVEAWYVVQAAEMLSQRAQSLPTIANKIVLRVSGPEPQ